MRALLPNKKEGDDEASEQPAKQVAESSRLQPSSGGQATSQADLNQKPGRNPQFSHVLHPGAPAKGK